MGVSIPPCPAVLKSIQPYLNVAADHAQRDVIISYWCHLYALQTGLQASKNAKEAKMFLSTIMDWLEEIKKTHADNEAISNEMAAQAYVENYALKLFNWADTMDRASNFTKNVVKAFYTSGILMDVLTVFGELGEDIVRSRKYAKWKASYLFNCLKTGETPIPGPAAHREEEGSEDEEFKGMLNDNAPNVQPPPTPPPSATNPPASSDGTTFDFVKPPSFNLNPLDDLSALRNPHPSPAVESSDFVPSQVNQGGAKLDPSFMMKAQKYCKFASSALNYDDVPEAIANLQKALNLLQTGKDE